MLLLKKKKEGHSTKKKVAIFRSQVNRGVGKSLEPPRYIDFWKNMAKVMAYIELDSLAPQGL